MTSLFQILAMPFGWILRLFGTVIPDYGIAIVLFLIALKLAFTVLDYFDTKNRIKNTALSKKIDVMNKKYITSPKLHEEGYLSLYKAAKCNPVISIIFQVLNLIFVFSLIAVIYNPLKYYFNFGADQIETIKNTASAVLQNDSLRTASDFNVINAIISNNGTFTGSTNQDIVSILNSNYSLFGISLITPVNVNSWQIVFPIAFLLYYVYKIVRMVIRFIKNDNKKKIAKKFALSVALQVFVLSMLLFSAFLFPFIYFVYIMIFVIIGGIGSRVIKKILKPFQEKFNADFEEASDKIISDIDKRFSEEKAEMPNKESLQQ